MTPRAVDRLPVSVVSMIAGHVLRGSGDSGGRDSRGAVEMAVACRAWSVGALQRLYERPVLDASESFESLLRVLPLPLPVALLSPSGEPASSSGSNAASITVTTAKTLPAKLSIYAHLVHELDLCGAAADNVYIGDLDGALALCANLRILRLGSVFHMSNMIVQSVATHCSNLVQLELPGCPVSDAFIPLLAKKCSLLLRFDAAFTNLTVGSLVPLIKFAASLLELDLSECRESDASLDMQVAEPLMRPLKFLNLRNTQITDPLLTFTARACPALSILVLESCTKITDASVTLLFSHCPALRSLDLSFCDNLTDASLRAATPPSVLEELYLSGLDLISARGIHEMVAQLLMPGALGRLELLVLDGCESVVGSYVKGFAASPADDLECELERDGLRRLALTPVPDGVSGGLEVDAGVKHSGMMSPAMQQMHGMMSGLKVEVSYADRELHGDRATGRGTKVMPPSLQAGGSSSSISTSAPSLGHGVGLGADGFLVAERPETEDDYGALRASLVAAGTGAGMAGVARRASKTLRHRKSLLGLSARVEEEDVEEVHEAAKMERVEKIKEKRRSGMGSGGSGVGGFASSTSGSILGGAGGSGLLGKSTLDMHERFLAAASIPRPASEVDALDGSVGSGPGSVVRSQSEPNTLADAETSKAAFLAAAAAKGLKISSPLSSAVEASAASVPGEVRIIKKRPSSILRPNVAEFVPSPPTTSATMDEPTYMPPPNNDTKVNRRISVGVPAGPPPPDSRLSTWSGIGPAPVGVGGVSANGMPTSILSPVSSAPAVMPLPQQIVTPTGESGVLLFSGRKSARMSINSSRDAIPTNDQSPLPIQQQPPVFGVAVQSVERNESGEEAPIVIASGRRRTRGTSIVDESKAASAVIQMATGVTPAQMVSSSPPAPTATPMPSWAIQSPSQPTPTPSGPWGTDPTVWNNPAQLTSASSTWSSAGPQQQGFNDPWAGSHRGAPASAPPNTPIGEPATSVLGPAPVINSMDPWAAPPPNAANAVVPPSAVVNAAAAAAGVSAVPGPAAGSNGVPSWQQQQQKAGIPQRPMAPSVRYGSVGGGGISNLLSTPPGLLANPPGLSGMARGSTAAPVGGSSASAGTGNHGEGGSVGFVYSAQNRGRLLLKLKIETKIGGEQMLAVHEYDDPQQLATEFVNYWELQAFKDPLVRLIAVRKTNVLRNRGAVNA
ncbi:hypothetical protein BC830DRAFT_1166125 [Chytriomyces sp. MP71]|nr:hypothetical protein BC830DRAFT_1166125 [Chytriomyces sp. MP71]